MTTQSLNNPLLHRYWFKTREGLGFGVTAYSIEDALSLLAEIGRPLKLDKHVVEVIEEVDIRELDQGHVIPNMGPPNFRGVWFPNLTLS
jgi:hypothetical protein